MTTKKKTTRFLDEDTVAILMQNSIFTCPAKLDTKMERQGKNLVVTHGDSEYALNIEDWYKERENVGKWLVGICKIKGHGVK